MLSITCQRPVLPCEECWESLFLPSSETCLLRWSPHVSDKSLHSPVLAEDLWMCFFEWVPLSCLHAHEIGWAKQEALLDSIQNVATHHRTVLFCCFEAGFCLSDLQLSLEAMLKWVPPTTLEATDLCHTRFRAWVVLKKQPCGDWLTRRSSVCLMIPEIYLLSIPWESLSAMWYCYWTRTGLEQVCLRPACSMWVLNLL